MPGDAEFTAKVPFTEDPEFIKLQRDLQIRQDRERKELEKKQMQQRTEFGSQPGVTRQQLEQNYQQQLQEREAQSKRFKAETDRYTREYHHAKVILTDMREAEKRQAIERGREDDPKLSR